MCLRVPVHWCVVCVPVCQCVVFCMCCVVCVHLYVLYSIDVVLYRLRMSCVSWESVK